MERPDNETPLYDATDHPDLDLVFADAAEGPVYTDVQLLTEEMGHDGLWLYQDGGRRTAVPRGGRMWNAVDADLAGRERA